MKKKHDVIIIGSGVSGALIACKLLEKNKGLDVLILEAGEWGDNREDLVTRYINSSTKSLTSPYETPEVKLKAPSPAGSFDYFDQPLDAPNPFKSTYERRVGGTTWHWLGNCPRLLPSDFESYTKFGIGIDWPITYNDLEPWYCAAEKELGVSGNHEDLDGLFDAQRSEPFPMHQVWTSYSDEVIAKSIADHRDALSEYNNEPFELKNTPQARNTTPYNGRPVCTGNSSCVPICPVGAKYDATIHVKRAQCLKAEVRDKAIVTCINADATGKIISVKYKSWDGSESVEEADVFVLAGNAIESAKLLLMSPFGDTHVANSSDQVGRNLMDHPQGEGLCVVKEPIFPFRGPPTTSGIDKFRDGAFRKDFAAFRLSMGNDGGGRTLSPQTLLDKFTQPGVAGAGVFGTQLRNDLNQRVIRQFRVSFLAEMLPVASNRVLVSDKSFSFNIPNPKIEFNLDQYTLRSFNEAGKVLGKLFYYLGSKPADMLLPRSTDHFLGAGHVMGTLRMGNTAANSVVDSNCRAHDHQNLFIAGAAVFPTCGTANPTLTIAALSLRLAAFINSTLNSITVTAKTTKI